VTELHRFNYLNSGTICHLDFTKYKAYAVCALWIMCMTFIQKKRQCAVVVCIMHACASTVYIIMFCFAQHMTSYLPSLASRCLRRVCGAGVVIQTTSVGYS